MKILPVLKSAFPSNRTTSRIKLPLLGFCFGVGLLLSSCTSGQKPVEQDKFYKKPIEQYQAPQKEKSNTIREVLTSVSFVA